MLSKDVCVSADYSFGVLETIYCIFHLMGHGHTVVLTNFNSEF